MGQVLQDAVEGIKSEARQQQWKLDLAVFLEKVGSLEDYQANLEKTIETNKKNVNKSSADLEAAKADTKKKFDEYKADLDGQIKEIEDTIEKHKGIHAGSIQSAKDEGERILASANNQANTIVNEAKKKQKAAEDRTATLEANLNEKERKLTEINGEIYKRDKILNEMKSRLAQI